MFINYTNHNSSGWGEKQKVEAEKYGEIVNFDFFRQKKFDNQEIQGTFSLTEYCGIFPCLFLVKESQNFFTFCICKLIKFFFRKLR